MRGKYVASIIREPSASLSGRHAQKSSGVGIVASISLYLHYRAITDSAKFYSPDSFWNEEIWSCYTYS